MRFSLRALCAGLLCWTAAAAAAECSVPEQIRQAAANSLTRVVLAVLATAPAKGVDCGSVASVWKKLSEHARDGGRKLEGDKPFDAAAARRQWDEALRDPQLAARLAALQKGSSDTLELMVLQAAVLDEEGLYLARDWRLHAAAAQP